MVGRVDRWVGQAGGWASGRVGDWVCKRREFNELRFQRRRSGVRRCMGGQSWMHACMYGLVYASVNLNKWASSGVGECKSVQWVMSGRASE